VSPLPAVALVGVRVFPLEPVDLVGYQQILVVDLAEPPVTQGTLSASFEQDRFGAAVGLPWVLTAGDGLFDVGPGRLRVQLGSWRGPSRQWFAGVQLGTQPFNSEALSVVSWTTRAQDSLPGTDLQLVFSHAVPHRDWDLGVRLAAGVQISPYYYEVFLPVVGELAVVWQVPVQGRWSWAGELELCGDVSWLGLRPLLRYSSPRFGLDMGVQVQGRGFLQPLVQLRWTDSPDTAP
jgi:hypothetical protein